MKRLLAATVALALIGVAIAERNSSVARARRSGPAIARVAATPRLKHQLQAEIRTLRAGQPSVARVVPRPGSGYVPVASEPGVRCFAAGPARCAELGCREFVDRPAVSKTPSPVTTTVVALACPLAPRKLEPASGP